MNYEIQRSDNISACYPIIRNYVDDFLLAYKEAKSTARPEAVQLENIAFYADKCIEPVSRLFPLFSDSDRKAWSSIFVNRYLAKAQELAAIQICINDGLDSCY